MNISEALCAAAEHIERHPESYNFNLAIVSGKEMGCMLGHFGRVAGLPAGLPVDTVALTVLGIPAGAFYDDIYKAASNCGGINVVTCAPLVPNAMREVAKKYQGIPEDVRAIFEAKAKDISHPVHSGQFYFAVAEQYARRAMEVSPT
jgi:hypothetical protein